MSETGARRTQTSGVDSSRAGLLTELKRRSVLRVAAAWLVFAWITLQIVEVVAPILLLPDWVPRLVLILLAIGFVIALVLSWIYEVTPEGIERTASVPVAASIAAETGKRLDRMVLAGLAVALLALGANRLWPREAERGSESVSGPASPEETRISATETGSDPLSAVAGIIDTAQRPDAVALVEGMAPRHRRGGKADQFAVLFVLLGAREQAIGMLPYIDTDLDYIDTFEALAGDPRFDAWRARADARNKGKRP